MDTSKKSELSINEQQRRDKILDKFLNFKKRNLNSITGLNKRILFMKTDLMPRWLEISSELGEDSEQSQRISSSIKKTLHDLTMEARKKSDLLSEYRAIALSQQLAKTEKSGDGLRDECTQMLKSIKMSDDSPNIKYEFVSELIQPRLSEMQSSGYCYISSYIPYNHSKCVNLFDSVAILLLDIFRNQNVGALLDFSRYKNLETLELARALARSDGLRESMQAEFPEREGVMHLDYAKREGQSFSCRIGGLAIPSESLNKIPQKNKSGCLSLLLISSLVVAPAIYSIINQTT